MERDRPPVSRDHKYTTTNPISRYLVANFFAKVRSLLSTISFETVLDIGCGEGVLFHHVRDDLTGKRVFAMDVDPVAIETAKRNVPFATCGVASVYALPFDDRTFDLVICSEVLEHLDNPDLALREIRRVTAEYCILSVPNEPIWRILNVVRGAYLRNLGNTPGHVNHWSSKAFQRYIRAHFRILETVHPLPWVGLLCRREGNQGT